MSNNGNATLPDSLGGSGGPSVREIRLLKRAIREQWDVPEDVFLAMPAVAAEYAKATDATGKRINDPRTQKTLSLSSQFAAMKILMDMKRQNVDTARLEIEAAKLEQGGGTIEVNMDVELSKMPVIEIVVNSREEVQQFADIRDQLIETIATKRLSSNGEK